MAAITTDPPEAKRDFASGLRGAVIWGLPALAMIISAVLHSAISIVWPVAQVWMGVACLVNARRCGRMHCYFTGPFFLIMAAASLAYGLELLPLGPYGWDWIGWTTIGGGLALSCITEHIWGRYRRPACETS